MPLPPGLARAASLPEEALVCLRHRPAIEKQDNRYSSPFPDWHSNKLTAIPVSLFGFWTYKEERKRKVSAQSHTIVKQICFPNGNVLFLLLFSLSKNWMHNIGWGCAGILPDLQNGSWNFIVEWSESYFLKCCCCCFFNMKRNTGMSLRTSGNHPDKS